MKKFLPILAFVMLVVPVVALAQAGQTATDIVCNVLQIAKNIVAAVGFGIAVILLIIAGIRYMTAGGDSEKAGSARTGIINALIGIVIVIAAVFLIALAQSLVSEVTGGINLLGNPCVTTP